MGEAWRGVWGAAMGEAWRGCGNPVLWAREMGLSDGRLGVVWGCPQREWLSLIFLSVDFHFFPLPYLFYSRFDFCSDAVVWCLCCESNW